MLDRYEALTMTNSDIKPLSLISHNTQMYITRDAANFNIKQRTCEDLNNLVNDL